MRQFCTRILFGLSLLSPAVPAWTQELVANRVSQAALRAHSEFLADDLLEGRATVSRGYELAAAYVASQFRQYGLLPAGDDGGYLQAVPLLEATPVLPASEATLRLDTGSSVDFEYGSDFLPSADFLASVSTLTAPLTFVGFGVTASELGYDDLADVDLQGRIAVLLSGAPPQFKPAQRAYYAWPEQKFVNLIAHGASGVIALDRPSSPDAAAASWERRTLMSWSPQMRRLDAQGEPVDVHRELKLRFDFSAAAGAKLFEGAARSLEEALTIAANGEAQSFPLSGILSLSATTGLRRTASSNVIGVLRGSDPTLRREFIVLSAHLDHLGRGPAVNGDGLYNGMHDNAVGVAMLLEVARAIGGMAVKPKRSIVFAAFAASDRGALGAAHWLRNRAVFARAGADGRVVAHLDIDTPLPFARTRELIALGAEQSSLGALAQQALRAENFRLSIDDTSRDASLLDGDALAFVREGVPSLALKSGNQPRNPNVELTTLKQDFFRDRYRRPSDDAAGSSIDYAAAADLSRLNLRIVWAAANGAERPHWYRDALFFRKFRAPSP